MLPTSVGIGLKARHYQQILEGQHGLEWFEIHPENFMCEGGLPHAYLSKIREDYAISMHGVGMSLGSSQGIDAEHLNRLKAIVDRYEPAQVSEHIAWSHGQEAFHNDLLPIPYTQESLDVICANIQQVQDKLGRTILVENPSAYLDFEQNEFDEAEFITALQKRTDCGLLLDINNVFVSANNLNFDAIDYLARYPIDHIVEVHLAGHKVEQLQDGVLLIDDHGSAVTDSVWALFEVLLSGLNKSVPVLIEWDTDVPTFDVMLAEANKASALCRHRRAA